MEAMEGPGVRLPVIKKLSLSVKEDVTRISFETTLQAGEIARLLNFAKQGRPMDCIISSPQATMDLIFTQVSLKKEE